MINPRRHNHQIALLQPNPHPIIALRPHIKIPTAVQNIPYLFILVQVLVEEVLYFLLIVGERGGGDVDLVAVFVVSFAGDAVDGVDVVGV
jgi:hypothetical protein